MDFRTRRYFTVKLPSGYAHNSLIRIIKSIPRVKVRPAKYPPLKMDRVPQSIYKRSFDDEQSPRGYYNIMVSVWGWYETKTLLYLLKDYSLIEFKNQMSFQEILPRGDNRSEF